MSRIHRYTGEQVIVEFELGRCIHTGDCTHALPAVFDTKRTGRWVHPDAASADEIAQVCADCPTGALRCVNKETGEAILPVAGKNTVSIVADGPLYVHADLQVNGEPEPTNRAALCRCGASRLMPRCDNSHRTCDFRDAGKVAVPLPSDAPQTGRLSITTTPDGPLMLEGPFSLLDADGNEVCKSGKAALCRCGASNMKPYCDGSHHHIGFKAE
ncbi:MAG: hypothetical protein COS82_04005 [Zetaproteobacteria bacterium CG06_land_8_20_14_3_00_59_53]|nr:MAG: hypothetical protein AUK36_08555 [Zetaproteobacteria bacterium CG2_30_59_37]PIO89149.1 MAG: hypothetical protein COX56_09385 [Zetaproteobacteria bacterium CG23_combo_of_CG06-09_8_20_14_all_59_86]PIQ64461.1 MAG: hypothetical protein COV97_09195 [Zetaproteobacteria bacterium CG11_big_fil_rev_8_21_14_0_20_59_439]PIU70888.1 MAG: hypothetical protein COS82_04005 [Zetaproteobacteria bacterium CG06_land_8_20_14_3_00_59_53]PIU96325.1 MAG: hypothetical protein COS62_09575 [Zetaproteobacteria bac